MAPVPSATCSAGCAGAFLERCAARGIRPVDVHRALEAYGKLALDLRRFPDESERECRCCECVTLQRARLSGAACAIDASQGDGPKAEL